MTRKLIKKKKKKNRAEKKGKMSIATETKLPTGFKPSDAVLSHEVSCTHVCVCV